MTNLSQCQLTPQIAGKVNFGNETQSGKNGELTLLYCWLQELLDDANSSWV